MKRITPTATLLIGLIFAAASAPASAGKKSDDSWAACIWEQAPTSANNWLGMAAIKSNRFLDKTNRDELLATRLQGFCQRALTPPGKKNPPSFDAKGVREALQRSRPPAIGPDRGISSAIRCEIFEGDILLGVTMGFGDPSALKPASPATAIKCQRILDDGSLQDA